MQAAMSVPFGSSSVTFLQSSFAYSQSLPSPKWNLSAFPLREGRTASLVVEAKSRTRQDNRTARHARIRKKVEGTTERPRLCVFRSNKHIHVQVIDDSKMHTLAAASTMQKAISEEICFSSGPTIEVAKKVGKAIAKSCLEKGYQKWPLIEVVTHTMVASKHMLMQLENMAFSSETNAPPMRISFFY